MPKQILLIDDSQTVQRMVQITFAHEDYALTAVKGGDEGIARAKDLRPDLVLVDAGLAGKSGYDVCAELRAAGLPSPVLLLTGNFSPYDEARGAKAGADGAVVKPFETQALIDKANDAIARKRGGAAASPQAPQLGNRPSTLTGTGPVGPAPGGAPPATPPAAPPKNAPPPRATIMGMQAINPATLPPGATPLPTTPSKPQMPPAWAPSAAPPATPKMNIEPLSKPLSVVAQETRATPPQPARTQAMPTLATTPPAAVPHAPPPMAPPPMAPPPMAPPPMAPPSMAPPSGNARPMSAPPAPQVAPPLAPPPMMPSRGAGTMPHDVPQMPRAPLIPNTPTPRPATAPANARTMTMEAPRAPAMSAPSMAPPMAPPSMAPAMGAAASSPEHAAVAQLSREVIERIVWEVVPELAEAIIREHVERLAKQRQG